ncbi:hypothetical protein CcaverHIS002_0105390 [Cutaneotrichosporon cavernicola]|nr:hypothetical protein CcaverHIS002_0105390 [Cutaneotrichosporon cavernicola]
MLIPFLTSLLSILPTARADSLFVTPSAPSGAHPHCFATSYRGHYAGLHAYLLSEDCTSAALNTRFESATLVRLGTEGRRIVWVGASNALPSTHRDMLAAWETIDNIASSLLSSQHEDGQTLFSTESFQVSLDRLPTLVHASESGLYLSVPSSILPVLDTFLPAHLRPVAFPPHPLALPSTSGNRWGIPAEKAEHLTNIAKNLRFDPKIAAIASTISAKEILEDVRYLTGEREDSDIESRHSFHPDIINALIWVRREMRALGIDCSPYRHEEGFAPGLLCSIYPESDSEEQVIISAHIDSRGTFGSLRAPGANDDGSGSAHLLAIARAISQHNVTFEHPVTFAFFTGEEQGLVMSNHFAHTLKKENVSVQLNLQADMLGYRLPGEPLQLALPATIDLPEASYLVANISQLYAPELVVGRTAACCSDHQSFLQHGFPATQVSERNGWIADPMYHNSGDLSDREGYDAEQIKSIAKVTMATVFEVAGWRHGK